MQTIGLAVLVAFVIAILVSLKKGNFTGWAFGLCIPAAIVAFFVAAVFNGLVPTATVVKNDTRQLVNLDSADKMHAQAGFMYMFGIVGSGSASSDEQYTYEFWAQNNDGSASHFKLRDGADTVRVFQDAAPGKGTWTVQVTSTNVQDENNKWWPWSFQNNPGSTTTTVNYFHVPAGTIVQQFKLQ
jgi:hypothetical protein